MTAPQHIYKGARCINTSCLCTKVKPTYLRNKSCHLALVSVCAVVTGDIVPMPHLTQDLMEVDVSSTEIFWLHFWEAVVTSTVVFIFSYNFHLFQHVTCLPITMKNSS